LQNDLRKNLKKSNPSGESGIPVSLTENLHGGFEPVFTHYIMSALHLWAFWSLACARPSGRFVPESFKMMGCIMKKNALWSVF
jgi:hypothetical protein